MAASVAARLHASGRSPLMIAISAPPTQEADWLAALAGTRRVTVFAASQKLKLSGEGRAGKRLAHGLRADALQAARRHPIIAEQPYYAT